MQQCLFQAAMCVKLHCGSRNELASAMQCASWLLFLTGRMSQSCLIHVLPCVSPSPSLAAVTFWWPHTYWGTPKTRVVVGSSGDDDDNGDDADADDAGDDDGDDDGDK
jgi:hypothetical protein